MDPQFVLAPAAVTFSAIIIDNRIPVAVGFCLCLGSNLEGKCLAMREERAAVQPDARNSRYRKFYGEHFAPLAAGKITGGSVRRANWGIRKSRDIKFSCRLGLFVKSQASLCFRHVYTPVRVVSQRVVQHHRRWLPWQHPYPSTLLPIHDHPDRQDCDCTSSHSPVAD